MLPEVLEGEWPGVLVVIGFPDLDAARAWYYSPAYQEILPLRTRNSDGVTLIVDGVRRGTRPPTPRSWWGATARGRRLISAAHGAPRPAPAAVQVGRPAGGAR